MSGSEGIYLKMQIFGTLKCQDSKKAQRYFRERRIPFQFVDLTRRGLSKGELNSLKAAVGIRCGARMRILAAINARDAIRKILACLGFPMRAPPVAQALPDSEGTVLW